VCGLCAPNFSESIRIVDEDPIALSSFRVGNKENALTSRSWVSMKAGIWERMKEEGGRMKDEGGRRKEEGGRRKEEG
jgi:hypothetical protein